MKFTLIHIVLVAVAALLLGGVGSYGFLVRVGAFRNYDGFTDVSPMCGRCQQSAPCGCGSSAKLKCPSVAPCPPCREPDMSKYVLKSQVPPCPAMPDLSQYMLKTECPPVPDLSKYILKSSIPKPQPVIIDNSSCKKDAGECPPCPRPRCPEVRCPPPTKCPPPAPCPRPVCPPTVVKCKSEEATIPTVRPFLAPLNQQTFGAA
jgi:hypothetical protein